MKRILDNIRSRFAALRSDENGMEAAQVILILAIVVALIIFVILPLVRALSSKGTSAITNINTV